MAKFEKTIVGNFEEVVQYLHTNILNSGISMKLVEESNFDTAEIDIAVRVYDKYYMRNGSRASLSLTVVGHGSDIFISAIGAGGGQGVFLDFSWGAEEDMIAIVRESIERREQ